MSKTLVDILIEIQKKKRRYFESWESYCREIKKIAGKILREVKVIVFGSIVNNKWTPSSDIDILIISDSLPNDFDKRAEIRTKIKSQIDPFSPFQIHLATNEEFEKWYKNIIKEKVELK